MTFGVMGGGSIQQGSFQVPRTLRLASTTGTYFNLSNTATAGNRTTWTFSAWVKRTKWDETSPAYQRILYNQGAGDEVPLRFRNNTFEIFFNGGASGQYITSNGARIDSGWFHFVVAVDTANGTASQRVKLYINGANTSLSAISTVPLNYQTGLTNSGSLVRFSGAGVERYEGLLAECYIVDGQALTPSSFGQRDPTGEHWIPKAYTGSYGTTGGYWNFSDNTSLTTLGYDYSGNGRNGTLFNTSLTSNNILYASSTDSPTAINADTAAYPLLNIGSYFFNYGGVHPEHCGATVPDNTSKGVTTLGMIRGRWYWEVTTNAAATAATTAALHYPVPNGPTIPITTGVTVPIGNTYGLRLDVDTGTFDYTADGSSFTNIATGLTVNGALHAYMAGGLSHINFGSIPFKYTPPSGYLKLNTFNLENPIPAPRALVYATSFNANDGTAFSLASPKPFAPDLVIIKGPSLSATTAFRFIDSIRGSGNALVGNTTAGSVSEPNGVTLTSTGITIGTDLNYNGSGFSNDGHVFMMKKSPSTGLDIVSYTGTGTARTVAHSLGLAPGFIIVKRTDTTGAWAIYHKHMTSASFYHIMNTSSAQASDTTYWDGTAPTSSVFSLGTNADVNASGGTYIAYIWADVPGFSKIGTYVGTGAVAAGYDGIDFGFYPQVVFVKAVNTTAVWQMYYGYMQQGHHLGGQSYTGINTFVYSNGLGWSSTGSTVNASGVKYMYLALASAPIKYGRPRLSFTGLPLL